MPYTDAQKKATAKYNAKAYDRIEIKVKKGQKEIIQKRAEQLNKSVNGYITDLIEEDLAGSNLLEEWIEKAAAIHIKKPGTEPPAEVNLCAWFSVFMMP